MYFRKNLDFSPDKEDFQIGEIDIGIKVNGETLGGAFKIDECNNQLHIEFKDEEELNYVIKFLRKIICELGLIKTGYYDKKPLLKNTYPLLIKIKNEDKVN